MIPCTIALIIGINIGFLIGAGWAARRREEIDNYSDEFQ